MATTKLHGRAFYESIGSPRYIVAPMVDQSEFAWRLLTRSFLPADLRRSILAYSPMFHAKLFADSIKYRSQHFEPLKPPLTLASPADAEHQGIHTEEDLYLDGNPKIDRPLFVQFCANDPEAFLEAAKVVQPFCDAVDLNLGCPQGIARRGNYGAFLQEDWDTIYKLINKLHTGLDIPVTVKFRIQETKEKTLEYAKMILSAGASIITVHGRQRHQKGHNTGLADWSMIRYLRDQLPPETVIFANGNILQYDDLEKCLEATKADGIMSAEGNLYDPSIFAAAPPVGEEGREYWRGRNGKGGYRCDAVLRRYLDIIHRYVLGQEPPQRKPLFLPSDVPTGEDVVASESKVNSTSTSEAAVQEEPADEEGQPPAKKQKRENDPQKKHGGKPEKCTNPNLVAMQAHCFHILRALVTVDHGVRDALARSRAGDIAAYENVLSLTEEAVKKGLLEYEKDPEKFDAEMDAPLTELPDGFDSTESSMEAVQRCRRPYWVCQSRVRPLPKEALEKGSLQLSKKEKAKLLKAEEQETAKEKESVGLSANGKIEVEAAAKLKHTQGDETAPTASEEKVEVPKEAVICG